MIFISYNQTSKILKPGKKPFNLPSSSIWSQLSAIPHFGLFSVHFIWRNHLNTAFLHQFLFKRIAVISFVSNKFIWRIGSKTAVDSFSTSFTSWGDALSTHTATGRPEASAIAMILVPLPRFVLPTARPLFCQCKAPVYERLSYIDLSAFEQVFGQLVENGLESSLLRPFLEAPMPGMVWQILPECAGSHNP